MENCKLIIIAAVSIDGVIGIDDQMPWRIPEDFKHFRETTMGNMLLVGYTTYKTLPPKAFEGREYMVLNGSHPIENTPNIYQFRSFEMISHVLNSDSNNVEKIFIAGGAKIYDLFIDHCDEAIITWVNKKYPEGNKLFPIEKLLLNFGVEADQEWQTSKTGLEYKITKYKRNG